MRDLIANRYTGLFRSLRETTPRAYDPDVAVWSGVPANRPWPAADAVGGAGWTDADAQRACLGEAIERWQTHALASDRRVTSTFAAWSHAEPALDPRRFVRFSDEQYASPGFPFERLTIDTELEWVACRNVATGEPIWVPAELVFMDLRSPAAGGTAPRFGPAISTGWAAHATPADAFAAAVRELVERDAVVGAWWGHYPLQRLATATVRAHLGADVWHRLARPNLDWRFYAITSPYSRHVTLATVRGPDGFAIGSACRLDRAASLEKAALEAVQGLHYVRYLLTTDTGALDGPPRSFAEHCVYYSRHPARLAQTCLARADAAGETGDTAPPDTLRDLLARVPPLAVRMATPPTLGDHGVAVVRVIAPELQPLHGDHHLPVLGGPCWRRPLADYAAIPPHPFA